MKNFKIFDHPRNASKIDLRVFPGSVLEFKTRISETKILVLCKIVKYFKIFDHLKNVWKPNLNVPPTLVLQFKTRVCGTRYDLSPFCVLIKNHEIFLKKP